MKFVKRISMFFILPMVMFAGGFAANMAIDEFFYPGSKPQEGRLYASEEKLYQDNEDSMETMPVSLTDEPVLNADTKYIIQIYDGISGRVEESEEIIPDKYVGWTRDDLIEELSEYSKTPSLNELEKGFEGAEVVSFSQNKVVVRKTYTKEELPEGYYLVNENNYVTVYYGDMKTLYMNTSIATSSLPYELQKEIILIKFMETEEELYNFLESHSS